MIKNKKIIFLIIIVVACVVTYFVGNAINDNYQKNEIKNKYEKSEAIDKKLKKLGFKKSWSNDIFYVVKKETDSGVVELRVELDRDYYDDDLKINSFTNSYVLKYSDEKTAIYRFSDNGKEFYWLDTDDASSCYKSIPEGENDDKTDLCNESQIKEVKKEKKAYNQLKNKIDATDEELAIWAAWHLYNEDMKK